MPKIDSPEVRLIQWLNERGLRGNPFAAWNAERDTDLAGYFVDVGQFDDLLRATEPCIVFARRGCGKTAQRQMLAAQCRPLQPDSLQLAITYTVSGFERVLNQVGEDVNQVRSIHHVNALLQLGLTVFMKDATPHIAGQVTSLSNPEDRAHLAAYVTRFAPYLMPASLTETPAVLDPTDSRALLNGFAGLVQKAGLGNCVVLVDGLDEVPLTAGDPGQIVTFLSPLLGTLTLIECPGMAFKFFMPQELEQTLRAQRWFRPDRLRLFPITWDAKGLLDLIKQRLAYFSQKKPPYKGLGQLCEDDLAAVINQELVAQAEKSPRVAMILASKLLQCHCQQRNPPELIELQTWEQVKTEWEVRRLDFIGPERVRSAQSQTTESTIAQISAVSGYPVLQVEKSGVIRLGRQEITREINNQDSRVLICLYKHQGDLCSYDLLAWEAWLGMEESNKQDMDTRSKAVEESKREAITNQAIAASIARLRRALGQSSPDEGYIETIKGRGYRLHPGGFKIAGT